MFFCKKSKFSLFIFRNISVCFTLIPFIYFRFLVLLRGDKSLNRILKSNNHVESMYATNLIYTIQFYFYSNEYKFYLLCLVFHFPLFQTEFLPMINSALSKILIYILQKMDVVLLNCLLLFSIYCKKLVFD